MTIHVLPPQQATPPADTSAAATAYDSVWADGEASGTVTQQAPAPQQGSALERTMLSHDKLYVVLAVVLLVWLGVCFLLLRTDRRLARLERRLDDTT